jgi:hypothetical protein
VGEISLLSPIVLVNVRASPRELRRKSMPKVSCLPLLAALLGLGWIPAYAQKAPHEIAGFVLGENISRYESQLNRKSAWPVRYREYLTEVDITPIDGYEKGTLGYGTCVHPGTIVCIKLKYSASDRRFFEELLTRYKERFGDPDELKGDPFQVIVAWKWSLKDSVGRRISLILQHSMDEDTQPGNSVRLTDMTRLEEERACDDRRHPELAKRQQQPSKSSSKGSQGPVDYQRFIPH